MLDLWPLVISSMVLDHLTLIEMLVLLIGPGPLELWTWYIQSFQWVVTCCFFHKLESYGTWGEVCDLISSFRNNGRLRVVLNWSLHTSIQVNPRIPQGSIFGPTLFLLYTRTIHTFPALPSSCRKFFDNICCVVRFWVDN